MSCQSNHATVKQVVVSLHGTGGFFAGYRSQMNHAPGALHGNRACYESTVTDHASTGVDQATLSWTLDARGWESYHDWASACLLGIRLPFLQKPCTRMAVEIQTEVR